MAQAMAASHSGRAMKAAKTASQPRRQREWARTLALFLCFAGFYLLTTSGHFYAVDEETNYVLTESIGARGTFELPRGAWGLVLSPQSPAPGPAYSIFAPGQAFAALPLFFIGELIAPYFPADDEGYVLRFFTSLVGSFVTAAMVALLYRLTRLLGYSGRVALALAVIYGLATTAWPQGRTFFAEPLTALLLVFSLYGIRRGVGEVRSTKYEVRSEDGPLGPPMLRGEGSLSAPHPSGETLALPAPRPPQNWGAGGAVPTSYFVLRTSYFIFLALAGAATVAALVAKPHAALALPGLGLYLLWRAGDLRHEGGRWRYDWRGALKVCVAFCVGGAVVTLPYALLNWRLFGGPLSTGYGTSPLSGFTHPFLRGLYGLTFSTGRGIFWFSPPLFLALFAARRFYRRHAAEAIACLVIVVTHYAFYCGHFEWAGGGAWGPRYLMIALPFAFLPIAAFLADLRGRWFAQIAATVIIAAGFVVQLLPLGTNFDFNKTEEERQNFVPAASPMLWMTRTFRDRAGEWSAVAFPPPNTAMLREGFLTRESEEHREIFPRWTNGAGDLVIYAAANEAHIVKLTFFDHRPANLRAVAPTILVDGVALPEGAVERQSITADGEGWIYQFTVPASAFQGEQATVTLQSAPWNPQTLGLSDRDENLGVFVHNVEAWRAGVPLTVADTPEKLLIDPLPRTPHWRFWWFNDDHTRHHLLDTWWWYAAVAGFPRDLTIRWIASFAGFSGLLIVLGLVLGVRSLPDGALRFAPRKQRRKVRRGAGEKRVRAAV